MDKVYEVENCRIKIKLEPGLIRLYSDNELWIYLDKRPKGQTERLVKIIKADYEQQFKKVLRIADDSMIVEIWAHVYCDYYALMIHRFFQINWIKKAIMKIVERAKIIDSGESEKDGNRWVWDFLAYFKDFIARFLPQNIGSKKLK